MKKMLFLVVFALILQGCAVKNRMDTADFQETNENAEENSEQITEEIVGGEEEIPEITEETEKIDINAIDNKGYGWGFKKERGKKPEIPKKTEEIFEKYDAIYIDNSGERVMYLTFDEGYEAGYTAPILDTLKDNGVKAAFFITGDYIDRQEELVKRMYEEGHIIGNHTEKHKNLHKLEDYKLMQEEFKTLDDKYYALFGEHMRYMRPPEGEYSERVLAAAQDAGYATVLWSFAYRDWLRDNVQGKEYAKESVIPYFHDGAILLLHAVSKDNADALDDIINEAKREGYEFKTLNDIKIK